MAGCMLLVFGAVAEFIIAKVLYGKYNNLKKKEEKAHAAKYRVSDASDFMDPNSLQYVHDFQYHTASKSKGIFSLYWVTADTDVAFVKIHANNASVYLFSDLCNVTLASRTISYKPVTRPAPRFMVTPLTCPKPDDPVYQRAPHAIATSKPKNITSAERILIVHKLMVRVKFGEEPNEYGIDRLLEERIIFYYYPIHEGPWTWTETGKLRDRQLLAKYWASYRMWYKEQPLHLVERYYGPEYGFYFAWVDHYIKMLIIPAILSFFVTIYGVATLQTSENIRSKEICSSNILMCPRCHYSKCKFELLKSACIMSHVTYIFDNTATYVFAIFIALWSTFFTELWKRREAVLKLQWHLKEVEHDTVARPAYLQKARKYKYSPVTRGYEPYIPFRDRIPGYTVTFITVLVVFGLILLTVVAVMVYQITMNRLLIKTNPQEIITKNRRLIASISGAFMSAIFIVSLKQFFKRVSNWLTKLENHRTQFEYDNAYIYKNYGFGFINHYAVAFYIAFFKGRFFTNPGDMKTYNEYGGLGSDICETSGCILDLSIQLIVVMVVKAVFSNFTQYINPIATGLLKRIIRRVRRPSELPFYQQQFIIPKTRHFFLVDEYIEMSMITLNNYTLQVYYLWEQFQ